MSEDVTATGKITEELVSADDLAIYSVRRMTCDRTDAERAYSDLTDDEWAVFDLTADDPYDDVIESLQGWPHEPKELLVSMWLVACALADKVIELGGTGEVSEFLKECLDSHRRMDAEWPQVREALINRTPWPPETEGNGS